MTIHWKGLEEHFLMVPLVFVLPTLPIRPNMVFVTRLDIKPSARNNIIIIFGLLVHLGPHDKLAIYCTNNPYSIFRPFDLTTWSTLSDKDSHQQTTSPIPSIPL
jgi:hypothetical protein